MVVPTASPEPLPTATAAPPEGTASITFLGVGVDGPAADASRDRVFTFVSDGAGVVEASAEAGGPQRLRLCLGRGAPGGVTAQQCRDSTEPAVTAVASAVPTTWTVTLTGAEDAGGTADLVLDFPMEEPSVTIDGFRFQGTAFDDYNGFLAEVPVAAGSLTVDAEWSGGSAPYRLSISAEGGTILDESGDGSGITADAIVEPGPHRIRLSNRQEFAEQDFTLRATIAWP